MPRPSRNPRDLSEHELRAAIEQSEGPRNRLIGAVQLGTASATTLGAIAVCDAFLPSLLLCLCVPPAMVLGVGVWSALGTLRSLPAGGPCRDELAFRAWQRRAGAPVSPLRKRRWAQRLMDREHAPDWLLLLDADNVPPGVPRRLKVEITLPPACALPFRARPEGNAAAWGGATADAQETARSLQPDEVEALLDLLTSFPDRLASFDAADEAHGCPGDLVIVRRSPHLAVHLTGDLLAPSAREPAVALFHYLARMSPSDVDRAPHSVPAADSSAAGVLAPDERAPARV